MRKGRVDGKVALVTGGARGILLWLCIALHTLGIALMLVAVDLDYAVLFALFLMAKTPDRVPAGARAYNGKAYEEAV